MTSLMVLASTIEDAEGLGKAVNGLLIGTVMTLMVTVSVITTWRKTNSLLAAGVAFVGGAALWYAVMNAAVFRDSVGEDLAPGAHTAGVTSSVVGTIGPSHGDVAAPGERG